MPFVGYARVSTPTQDLGGQLRQLEAAGVIRTFTDTVSGRATERPGLAAALDFAREGDVLAVVRLDRLGRSLRELLAVVADLDARGLGLRSLKETIDTTTPAGRLTFHLFGSIAEFERELIVERTRDGLEEARARGKVPGRRPVDPAKADAVRRLVASGLSVTEAARRIGMGRSTAYRVAASYPRRMGEIDRTSRAKPDVPEGPTT